MQFAFYVITAVLLPDMTILGLFLLLTSYFIEQEKEMLYASSKLSDKKPT